MFNTIKSFFKKAFTFKVDASRRAMIGGLIVLPFAKYLPVAPTISLVRRAMPSLIAYDICGVQPMTGPTGLIFAMRSYGSLPKPTPIQNQIMEAVRAGSSYRRI